MLSFIAIAICCRRRLREQWTANVCMVVAQVRRTYQATCARKTVHIRALYVATQPLVITTALWPVKDARCAVTLHDTTLHF